MAQHQVTAKLQKHKRLTRKGLKGFEEWQTGKAKFF